MRKTGVWRWIPGMNRDERQHRGEILINSHSGASVTSDDKMPGQRGGCRRWWWEMMQQLVATVQVMQCPKTQASTVHQHEPWIQWMSEWMKQEWMVRSLHVSDSWLLGNRTVWDVHAEAVFCFLMQIFHNYWLFVFASKLHLRRIRSPAAPVTCGRVGGKRAFHLHIHSQGGTRNTQKERQKCNNNNKVEGRTGIRHSTGTHASKNNPEVSISLLWRLLQLLSLLCPHLFLAHVRSAAASVSVCLPLTCTWVVHTCETSSSSISLHPEERGVEARLTPWGGLWVEEMDPESLNRSVAFIFTI